MSFIAEIIMFSKSMIATALAVGFAAGSAHAQQRLPEVADPARVSAPVVSKSSIELYKRAQDLSQATNTWDEANAAVTSQGEHDMHGIGHGTAPSGAPGAHADHTNVAPASQQEQGPMNHAGHAMPSAPAAADPHAGHVMPKAMQSGAHKGHAKERTPAKVDHSGHNMQQGSSSQSSSGNRQPVADPHAGHKMPMKGSPAAPAGQADHSMHRKPTAQPGTAQVSPALDPHAGHGNTAASTQPTASPSNDPHAGHVMPTFSFGFKSVKSPAPDGKPAVVKPAPKVAPSKPAAKPAATPKTEDHGGHR